MLYYYDEQLKTYDQNKSFLPNFVSGIEWKSDTAVSLEEDAAQKTGGRFPAVPVHDLCRNIWEA